MAKTLVIVESPAKAKKIGGFLGPDYAVRASFGHVRDLPAKAADVPAKFKKESWSSLGVNVEEAFDPLYVVPPDKKKVITELKGLLKDADQLYIATDEDREGEAIGWHILELLKPKVPVKRMVFSEITKKAIQEALTNTRELDTHLVEAQETRRVLDRLYGYTVSPLLWKKINRGLSAGRVQSVATRILVQRELERLAFQTAEYWDIDARLTTGGEDDVFTARLFEVNRGGGWKPVAGGKDFEDETGQLKSGRDVVVLSEADAVGMANAGADAAWTVQSVEKRPGRRKSPPPFITSSMQQAANNVLGMTARQAMQVAQRLYEDGHITYMRTDSVNMSGEALSAAKDVILNRYSPKHFAGPKQYKSKDTNAQEAHECIRPAGAQWQTAKQKNLTGEQARLYSLIYAQAVASQMSDHEYLTTTYTVVSGDGRYKASGTVDTFLGWRQVTADEVGSRRQDTVLPAVEEGGALTLSPVDPPGEGEAWTTRHETIKEAQKAAKQNRFKKKEDKVAPPPLPNPAPLQHFTNPPARYTEATLVRKLEEAGVGRPSTYASIISTIQDRGYVKKNGNQLVPTFTAMAVTRLMENNFPDLVDLEFTAKMERELDEIAGGKQERLPYLDTFYNGEDGLQTKVTRQEETIDPRDACTLRFEKFTPAVRVGRYGPYFETENDKGEKVTASIPDDKLPDELDDELAAKLIELKERGPQSIGMHPEEGLEIYVKTGPFGPYLQMGEQTDDGPKPKRVSIPKGVDPDSVDLDTALEYLAMPIRLGHHPVDNKVVNKGIGRFGPYVQHAGRYKSLEAGDDILTVNLDRAVELLKSAKGKKVALKVVGEHPADGKPVEVHDGKYGPYVKHGKINATLPEGIEPGDLTMDKAVELLTAKAERSGKKVPKKKGVKKKAAKKRSSKKKAPKKTV